MLPSVLNHLTSLSRKLLGGGRQARVRSCPRSSRKLGMAPRLEELENHLVPTTSVLAGTLPAQLHNQPIAFGAPGSPQWCQTNLSDPGVRGLVQGDFASHGSLPVRIC